MIEKHNAAQPAPSAAPIPAQPVAYAVFEENGNVRIWFGSHAAAMKWAVSNALNLDDLTPLYTAPEVQAQAAAPDAQPDLHADADFKAMSSWEQAIFMRGVARGRAAQREAKAAPAVATIVDGLWQNFVSRRVRMTLNEQRDLFCSLDAAIKAAPAPATLPFMYAIMDSGGKPYFGELCVSGEASDLWLEVNGLNDSPDAGYSIVPVYLAAAGNSQGLVLTDQQILQMRYAMDGWGEEEGIRRARARLAMLSAAPSAPVGGSKP